MLDFLSNYGQPLDFYVDWLEERYPGASTERVDWLPHEASVHELGTGKSRVERLVELRCKIERVPKLRCGRRDQRDEARAAANVVQ